MAETPRLGYLQLCAERRYHRITMEAFERATGLGPDEYWIEARAGGSPGWADKTITARNAFKNGARIMGWAAHGDVCLGFPGASNLELRHKLAKAVRKRREDFPQATHLQLFGEGDRVEVVPG
jgi:hypothetical protein